MKPTEFSPRFPIFLLTACLVHALSASPISDPRSLALQGTYQAEIAARADLPYQSNLAKLNQQLDSALQRLEKEAIQAGELEGVTTVRAERELLSGPSIPAKDDDSLPENLKKMRESYRTQKSKLENLRIQATAPILKSHHTQLRQLEQLLTRELKIEEAKALRAYRESLPRDATDLSPGLRIERLFSQASKESPYENSLGMKFVPVRIVSDDGTERVILYSIWESRVMDYAAYAAAVNQEGTWTNQTQNGVTQTSDHPVLTVDAPGAVAFCEWLSEKEDLNYRLPTTDEFAWAAEIRQPNQSPDELAAAQKLQPWRPGQPSREVGNFGLNLEDDHPFTSPAGSYPPNGHGIYDIFGNAWEWVSVEAGRHLRRGGSWGNNAWFFNGREEEFPGNAGPATTNGFRVVIDVGSAESSLRGL